METVTRGVGHLVLTSGSQSVVPGPESPGNWLKMQISRSHPKPKESERLRACVLTSPPGDSDPCPRLRTTGSPRAFREGLPEKMSSVKPEKELEFGQTKRREVWG